jgi:hypothetical protein
VGVAAVKSEQAETRAQRRKHAKSHGMEYVKGCAAGHHRRAARASVMEWELREETDSFRFATCIIQVLAGRRGCASGLVIRYGLRVVFGQEVEVVVPSGSVRRGRMRIIWQKRFRRMPDVKRELDGGYPPFPASQSQWTSNEPETRQKQMSFQSPQLRVVGWLPRMALEKPRLISLCSTTGNGADGEVRIRFNLSVSARASAK